MLLAPKLVISNSKSSNPEYTMIVDFPILKADLDRRLRLQSRAAIRSAPFLGAIRWHFQHEGDRAKHTNMNGEEQDITYREAQETVAVTREDIAQMTAADVHARMIEAATSVAQQTTRGALEDLSVEITRAGNSMSVQDPASPEAFLAMLDRISIDFDDAREHPQMPTLFAHPSQQAKVEAHWNSMTAEQRADFEARKEAILDRKWAEYVSRENNRKLVD